LYKDFEKLESKYIEIRESVRGKYYLRKFVLEDEIGEAYMKADLVVSRSGAHTTSEIIALQKPSLLIPIPWVSHNEQYENAKMVKDLGLAVILNEKDLTPETLVENIMTCFSLLNSMKINNESALDFLKNDPSELIANEIIQISEKI
jgi:UDP-N-acetylglucosamine--N-acetylmuramyl-(pentapeptide) pyrophosphoryl-undecaprenol N-acetylglucosamine transferase